MHALFLLIVIIIFVALLCFNKKSSYLRENYRDPIYLNREIYALDIYPRSNGSIYGFPIKYGGSWNLFSGFPWYDKAY